MRDAPRAVRLLIAGALWAALTPPVTSALGWSVDVAATVEVADHVVPGLLVLGLCVAWIVGGRGSDTARLAIAALVVLSGLWMLLTHVPLVIAAAGGDERWGPAIGHALPGLAVTLAAARLAAVALRVPAR